MSQSSSADTSRRRISSAECSCATSDGRRRESAVKSEDQSEELSEEQSEEPTQRVPSFESRLYSFHCLQNHQRTNQKNRLKGLRHSYSFSPLTLCAHSASISVTAL
eukprot:2073693-Pyramimonas_sp.AAC.1